MRILITDDHQLFADGLRLVLEDLGEQVKCTVVLSAELALDMLNQDHDFDLLVVDLNLPGIDGMSLLHSLSERDYNIPIVVVSATDSIEEIMLALDQGIRGFIPKSFDRNEIHAALKVVLAGIVYVPENIAARIERIIQSKASFPDLPNEITTFGITKRQFEVLEFVAKGYSNKQIANSMFLTEHTIKVHLKALFRALQVSNRTELTQKAADKGILP